VVRRRWGESEGITLHVTEQAGYVAHNISEFQRTGFDGGLNYYRACEPYFYLSAPWKEPKITQPSFYMVLHG